MKISTKQSEVLCLTRNLSQYALQLSGNTLKQVDKFVYLGVQFTSNGRRSKEINTRISKANAVLRELISLCGDKTGVFKHRKAFSF